MRVIRVFVYGTLRRGERAHRLLAGGRFLGQIRTEPAFELADAGPYPGLVKGGAVAIWGELWEISPTRLPALDDYEGPDYRRVSIRLEDGTEAHAWVMEEASAEGLPRIGSGDWLRRTRRPT